MSWACNKWKHASYSPWAYLPHCSFPVRIQRERWGQRCPRVRRSGYACRCRRFLCWEALVTRPFLPRFTWRWRTRPSASAQPPPVRATSTWAPSWAPPGAPGPRLWVRMNPSAAAVPYVVSGTLEFVFKKKKKGKNDWKCRCSSCHMSEMWPNPLLGVRGFVALGRVSLWSRRWLLGSAFTPGSSFSSFPNLLEGKKKKKRNPN